MKVSIITCVFNCKQFIETCLQSVIGQDYSDIEFIVIDGGSTDGTAHIIDKYRGHIARFVCQPDGGYYDALNKGIAIATGDIIGSLGGDDLLASPTIITEIVNCFRVNNCEVLYGNLIYVRRNNVLIRTRSWNSGPYLVTKLLYGWVPPHPTLYVHRRAMLMVGKYKLDYGACADYDWILRLLYRRSISVTFLNKLIVVMRAGGMSNGSFKKILSVLFYDYKVLCDNSIRYPIAALLGKKIRKIHQFVAFNHSLKRKITSWLLIL